jgi:Transposase, Mutator family
MSEEADGICGAPYGERSEDRTNRRHGYRTRAWETRTGTMDLVGRPGRAGPGVKPAPTKILSRPRKSGGPRHPRLGLRLAFASARGDGRDHREELVPEPRHPAHHEPGPDGAHPELPEVGAPSGEHRVSARRTGQQEEPEEDPCRSSERGGHANAQANEELHNREHDEPQQEHGPEGIHRGSPTADEAHAPFSTEVGPIRPDFKASLCGPEGFVARAAIIENANAIESR